MGLRDIDKGYSRVFGDLTKMDRSSTKVGVQQGTLRKDPDRPISEMVKIAAVQEFGSRDGNIPSRPFMRNSIDGNLADLKKTTEALCNKVLKGSLTNRQALVLLGEYQTAQVKKSITRLKTPPNSDKTVQRKNSSNPLIDTGQLRNSITHEENF